MNVLEKAKCISELLRRESCTADALKQVACSIDTAELMESSITRNKCEFSSAVAAVLSLQGSQEALFAAKDAAMATASFIPMATVCDFVDCIATFEDDFATNTLLEFAEGAEILPMRERAVMGLARQCRADVVGRLIEFLSDPEKRIRIAAIGALEFQQNKEATEALIRFVRKKSGHQKEAAIRALGKHEGDGALSVIAKYLTTKSADLRIAAISALSRRCEEDARLLLDLVDDPLPLLRVHLAGTLELFEGEAFTNALLVLCQDGDLYVRKCSISALAKRAGPIVTQAMCEAAVDPETCYHTVLLLEKRDGGITALHRFLLAE